MKEIRVFNNHLSGVFKQKLTKTIHGFDTIKGGVGERNIINRTQ